EADDEAFAAVDDPQAPYGLRAAHLEAMPGGRYLVRRPLPDSPVDVLAGTDPRRDEAYALLRLTAPALEGEAQAARRRGVFLLDTSWSGTPGRFGVDVALLEAILRNNPALEEFAVLTFDTGARWLTQGWRPNQGAERDGVLATLDRVLLEGATDVGAALQAVREAAFIGGEPIDLFVLTDGALTWGDADAERIAQRLKASGLDARVFAYRTGLGAENGALLAALTRRGAAFNCLTADSVAACSTAHTAPGLLIDTVEVVGVGEQAALMDDLVVAGGQATLFPGAQLTVAGRLLVPGDAELRITGTRAGEAVTLSHPVTLTPTGELAPRAWGELAVARLLAPRDGALDQAATAIAQHFRIISRVTSLLVLEADADYATYDLDAAQGELPEGVAPAVEAALALIGVERTDAEDLLWSLARGGQDAALEALEVSETLPRLQALAGPGGFSLPDAPITVPLGLRDAVAEAYVDALAEVTPSSAAVDAEAERRHAAGDEGPALRALSTLVEVRPGDAELTRQVAYRLLSWGLEGPATRLLFEVIRRRPFEPQGYRDLATALAGSRPALAALLYEVVLAGSWDARFHRVQQVVAEEYSLFAAGYIEAHPGDPLSEWLVGRAAELRLPDVVADLRVTITWNTDNTDVDLWVTEPSGEKCYYANRTTAHGGELLDDVTQGFGPERYRDVDAEPGVYRVEAHYYGNNGNRLTEGTQVRATIARYVGTPLATVQHYDVALVNVGDVAHIADVVFEE
ncbi:MAG: VWA domain-containing protein, partial [Myxococcales bacterium]|nr:VWA domain-containing protein [Myxococcales bacterium]